MVYHSDICHLTWSLYSGCKCRRIYARNKMGSNVKENVLETRRFSWGDGNKIAFTQPVEKCPAGRHKLIRRKVEVILTCSKCKRTNVTHPFTKIGNLMHMPVNPKPIVPDE